MSDPAVRPVAFGREEKLSLASLVVIVGFLVAVVFHYWLGAYEGLHYPYDTYLGRQSDTFHFLEPVGTRRHAFGDLLAVCIHARDRTPYRSVIPGPDGSARAFPSNYPPLGAMVAYPLTFAPYPTAIALFLAVSVACLGLFGWAFFRTGKPVPDAIHVVSLCFMSYPVHFVLDRGNIEIVVFALLAAFSLFLVRRRGGFGAGVLGAAIAMKVFPAVFLPLVLRRWGWRGAVATILWAGGLTLAALVAMAPPLGESVWQLGEALRGFSGRMEEGLNTASLSSGLYAPVALLDWYAAVQPSWRPLANVLRASYPLVAVTLFAAVAWLTVAGRLRTWEASTLATLCMIALPKSAPDYRLVHLLVPFALFVHSRTSRSCGIAVTLLFGLLLIPKAWVWIAPEVSIGALLNPACMVTLAAVVIRQALDRHGNRPTDSFVSTGNRTGGVRRR